MLTRVCAGGVVFFGNRVFIIKNDKGEWVLPKGVIRNNQIAPDVARERVEKEGGIEARILSTAGETSYEFYSYSRKVPVCNKIHWFIMEAYNDTVIVNKKEGFTDGGFYSIDEALEKVTYSQDKSLVWLALKRYKLFLEEDRKQGLVASIV